jgi:signal transduction histidine kinase
VLNAVGESWTNGEASPQGYVYSSDVAGEQVTSPSQAAEYMQDRVDADGDIWIDLYEVDGKTVIGRLILGHVDSGNSVDAK